MNEQNIHIYQQICKALKNTEYVYNDNKHLKNNRLKNALDGNNSSVKKSIIVKLIKQFSKVPRLDLLHTINVNGQNIKYIDLTKISKILNMSSVMLGSPTDYINQVGLSYTNRQNAFLNDSSHIVLNFPYKDSVLKGSMQKADEPTQEAFLNNILSQDEISEFSDPKVLIDAKKYDRNNINGHPINSFNPKKDSLFVKGNNLEALYSLLPIYAHKVKLIYIDPPFNTGHGDFPYNDKFTRQTNDNSNNRHSKWINSQSTWLTFMKNRLDLAKQFLKSDGLIFVNIDNRESAYLKVLMDEIFGEENYINTISFESNHMSGVKVGNKNKTILRNDNYLLVYAKNYPIIRKQEKINPIYVPKKTWDTHYNYYVESDGIHVVRLKDFLIHKGILKKHKDKNETKKQYAYRTWNLNKDFRNFVMTNSKRIFRTNHKEKDVHLRNESRKEHKNKLWKVDDTKTLYNGGVVSTFSESLHSINGTKQSTTLLGNLWKNTGALFDNTQNEGGISFPAGKKPERLLKRIISMGSSNHKNKPNDIVMDFFAGSATTQAVAMKMHRRFIGIEQMDYPTNKNNNTPIYIKRLQNVINGEQSGISKDKDINWHGSTQEHPCSFIYAELMPKNTFISDMIKKVPIDNLGKLEHYYYLLLIRHTFEKHIGKNINKNNKYSEYKVKPHINVYGDLFKELKNIKGNELNKEQILEYIHLILCYGGKVSKNNEDIVCDKYLQSYTTTKGKTKWTKSNLINIYKQIVINVKKLLLTHSKNITNQIINNNNVIAKLNLYIPNISKENNKKIKIFKCSIDLLSLCPGFYYPWDIKKSNINKKHLDWVHLRNFLLGILDKNQDYYDEYNMDDWLKQKLSNSDWQFNKSFYKKLWNNN